MKYCTVHQIPRYANLFGQQEPNPLPHRPHALPTPPSSAPPVGPSPSATNPPRHRTGTPNRLHLSHQQQTHPHTHSCLKPNPTPPSPEPPLAPTPRRKNSYNAPQPNRDHLPPTPPLLRLLPPDPHRRGRKPHRQREERICVSVSIRWPVSVGSV